MILFIDNDEYKSYDRIFIKQKGKKPLMFMKKYIEDDIEKWEYVVKTIKNKQYIMYWKKSIDKSEIEYDKNKSKIMDKLREEKKLEYINNKNQKREAYIKKRQKEQHEYNLMEINDWKKSPLSIKLYGDKEYYDPNFSDEENAAMFYCSEWLRKSVNFRDESIFCTCQRLYNVDIQKIQSRMTELSVQSVSGNKFKWYVIQPYVYEKENNIYHYFPKTIIKALHDDNIERRMRITPEISHLYRHETNANILGTFFKQKLAKEAYDELPDKEVDNEFIEKMNFTFIKCNTSGLRDEEYIANQADMRYEILLDNGMGIDYNQRNIIYEHLKRQYYTQYNIENYLKIFSNLYTDFGLEHNQSHSFNSIFNKGN